MEARGLLYSQVGYDLQGPRKALVRGPQDFLSSQAVLALEKGGKEAWSGPLKAWGPCWKTHWWVADFSALAEPGLYTARVMDKGQELLRGENLEIGEELVFKKTAKFVGWDEFEKRRIFAAVQPGWFDAGALWQEVCSHVPAIVGLADLARISGSRLSADDLKNTLLKVEQGSDYLGLCQDKAESLGKGACVVHDLAKAPESISSNDAFMAALAWAKAAELLKAARPEKAAAFAARAGKALDWIEKEAQPVDPKWNMPFNQGWAEGEAWPSGWMTRYLMLNLWAEILLKGAGYRDREDRIALLSAQILKRQVPREDAEHGLWGHFYAYEGAKNTEKGWSHGMPPQQNGQNTVFGSDMGAVFAHPLHCFLDGLRLFPGHGLAPQWKKAAEDFALNYFKPACSKNPFGLLPRGVFGTEGLLHFAGLWHGCNTLYGQAAALAFEFEKLTKDPAFHSLGVANLQWICGLNAGLTQEAADLGCVMDGYVLPPGEALPVSMIQRVGYRLAGNWTMIKGSVCNGFSNGKQFTYDVPPTRAGDAPDSLTDEDWITHAGGFLMGLARS